MKSVMRVLMPESCAALRIAADGVEVAAERRPVHDDIGGDDQERGDPDRHRNAEQHAEAENVRRTPPACRRPGRRR